MPCIVRPTLALLLSVLCFTLPAHAKQSKGNATPMETMQYSVQLPGGLTEQALRNATYMLMQFGSIADGTYEEEPPYTPVTFHNGQDAREHSKISVLGIGVGADGKTPMAAMIISSFDGANGCLGHIVFIAPDGNGFRATQAMTYDISRQSWAEAISVRKGTAEVQTGFVTPYPKPNAKPNKGMLRFSLKGDTIFSLPDGK